MASRSVLVGIVALTVCLAFARGIRANPLVDNGDFELGCLCGWTLNDPSGNTGVSIGNPHQGTYGAFLGAASNPGSLSQTLTTPAGAYNITFFLATDAARAQSFQVSLGGANALSLQ